MKISQLILCLYCCTTLTNDDVDRIVEPILRFQNLKAFEIDLSYCKSSGNRSTASLLQNLSKNSS